jgi:hypothetical protein
LELIKYKDLSWERRWSLLLDDCLGLYNAALSLSDFTIAMCIEFEPSVVPVGDHCTKSKESSCRV